MVVAVTRNYMRANYSHIRTPMFEAHKSAIFEVLPILVLVYFLVLPVLLTMFLSVSIARKVYTGNSGTALGISLFTTVIMYNLFQARRLYTTALTIIVCGAGFLLGYLFRKNMVPGRVLLCSLLFFIICFTAGSTIYYIARGQLIIQAYHGEFTSMVDTFLNGLEQDVTNTDTGTDPDQKSDPAKIRTHMRYLRTDIISRLNSTLGFFYPALLLIPAITMGFIAFFRGQQALLREKNSITTPLFFPDWKCPDLLVWVFIAGGLATATRLVWPETVFPFHFGVNLLVPVLWIYFIQGLSVTSFFARYLQIPGYIRWFFYLIFAIRPQFQLILSGIGIADTWINFRQLTKVKPDENNDDDFF